MATKRQSGPIRASRRAGHIESDGEEIRIEIDYESSRDIPAQWSNRVVLMHDDHKFYINFFQVIPPVLGGVDATHQQRLQRLREMGSRIPAMCVARLVVDVDGMEAIVKAFQANLSLYRSTRPGDFELDESKEGDDGSST